MRPPCEIVVQAAVSHYLHAKRGDKRMKQLESIPSLRLRELYHNRCHDSVLRVMRVTEKKKCNLRFT